MCTIRCATPCLPRHVISHMYVPTHMDNKIGALKIPCNKTKPNLFLNKCLPGPGKKIHLDLIIIKFKAFSTVIASTQTLNLGVVCPFFIDQ